MRFYITCPECGNRFPVEINSSANGTMALAECGVCECSIELEMDNGLPKIEDYHGATWDCEHSELHE